MRIHRFVSRRRGWRVLRLSSIPLCLAFLLPSCSGDASTEARRESLDRRIALENRARLEEFGGLGVALMPGAGSGTPKSGTRVEALSSKSADLRDVLMTLFQGSEINLLIDDGVAKKASFDIKESTLEQAFLSLLEVYDLSYRWDGSFLRIVPKEQRIFDVDFPSEQFARSTGLDEEESGTTSQVNQQSISQSGGTNAVSGDFWSALRNDLTDMMEGVEDGKVLINRRLGTVSVEGPPSVVRRVEAYLRAVRRRSMQQVSIEARILEVKLNREFKAGVDYSLLPGFLNSRDPIANRSGTLTGGAVIAQSTSTGAESLKVGFLNAGQFSIFIDALQSQGQVRVLSSPRVSTLNNVPAIIRVVEQVPVIEREIIDNTTSSRTQFNVRFEDAGVAVSVTPQIGEDGVITAVVRPSIIEVSGFVSTPDKLITEPILNTRTLTTTLRIPDGTPVVLGGLRAKRKTEDVTGIPLLADLPGLGALFRSTVQRSEDTELVIVLFPRILSSSWEAEHLGRSLDRVLRLRRPFRFGTALEKEDEGEWVEPLLGGKARSRGLRADRLGGTKKSPHAVGLSRTGLSDLALKRAHRHLAAGDATQARREILEAISLDPEKAEAWLLKGVQDMEQGRAAAAEDAFRRVLELDSGNLHASVNLGLLQLRAGNALGAEHVFRSVLEGAEIPEVRNDLGIALLRQDRLEEARQAFVEALTKRPDLVEAHGNLAVCAFRLGDLEGARKAYREFLMAGGDPGDPRLLPLRESLTDS